jgi:hypothetical protein
MKRKAEENWGKERWRLERELQHHNLGTIEAPDQKRLMIWER